MLWYGKIVSTLKISQTLLAWNKQRALPVTQGEPSRTMSEAEAERFALQGEHRRQLGHGQNIVFTILEPRPATVVQGGDTVYGFQAGQVIFFKDDAPPA